MAVAKFFFANAISFNASSSLYYTEMFDAIRPGYRPPIRKQLAAADVTNEMQKQLTTCAINNPSTRWLVLYTKRPNNCIQYTYRFTCNYQTQNIFAIY